MAKITTKMWELIHSSFLKVKYIFKNKKKWKKYIKKNLYTNKNDLFNPNFDVININKVKLDLG